MSIPFENVKGAIPTFPEEDKITTLAGAPLSERDSIFYPEAAILEDITSYAGNPDRETLARSSLRFSQNIAKDPLSLVQAYRSWEELVPEDPQRAGYSREIINSFKSALERNLKSTVEVSRLNPLNPADIADVMELLTYEDTQNAGAQIIEGMLSRKLTHEQIVEFRYTVAEWGLAGHDFTRLSAALKVLTFDNTTFSQSFIQKNAEAAVTGSVNLDPETFRKAAEVDQTVITLLPIIQPEQLLHYKSYFSQKLSEGEKGTVGKYIRWATEKDANRMRQITEYHDSSNQQNLTEVTGRFSSTYPGRYLLDHQGPVIREALIIYSRMRNKDSEYMLFYAPDSFTALYRHNSEAARVDALKGLKAIYSGMPEAKGSELYKNAQLARNEALLTVASFLHPPTTKYSVLSSEVNALRLEVFSGVERTVSPRGDFVTLEDPTLRDLGYRALCFRYDSKGGYNVDLYVGGYRINLAVNRNMRLTYPPDGTPLNQPLNSVDIEGYQFLSLVVLSELKQILCSSKEPEPDEDSYKDTELGASSERETKFTSRRAHLRTLKRGEHPHKNQVDLALGYSIDLERLNAGRLEQGLTPRTFVKETVIEGKTIQTPFYSKSSSPIQVVLKNILSET